MMLCFKSFTELYIGLSGRSWFKFIYLVLLFNISFCLIEENHCSSGAKSGEYWQRKITLILFLTNQLMKIYWNVKDNYSK